MKLINLLSMSRKQQTEVVNGIDPAQVKGRALKRQLTRMKKKEGGFTLLELLVVVGIIAAIAGTATILLRDTDRQAMAAAHVAMMDELMKGIETYKKLNAESFPTTFDSLMRNATNTLVGAASVGAVDTDILNQDLFGSLAASTITGDAAQLLIDSGVTNVRIIDNAADPNGAAAGDCSATDIKTLIGHKGNNVTASTIFRTAGDNGVTGFGANGCGYGDAATSAPANYTLSSADVMAIHTWPSTGAGRVNADPARIVPGDQTLVALGIGPDSSLFDPSRRGAMTGAPIYRHVAADEYNRFVVLFNVDETAGEVRLQAIIDGAGDTKDEELGEWDNTRPT
jgi:prepilin-type N-terminal cleavage/methylation domain-containing protein